MTKPLAIRSVLELFDLKTQKKIKEAELPKLEPPKVEDVIPDRGETVALYRAPWQESFWYTTDYKEAAETAREIVPQEPAIVGRLLKNPCAGAVPFHRLHDKGSAHRLQLGTDLEALRREANSFSQPLFASMGYAFPPDRPERGTIPLHHMKINIGPMNLDQFTTDVKEIGEVQRKIWGQSPFGVCRFEYVGIAAYICPPA
jgi:hypothetical protein